MRSKYLGELTLNDFMKIDRKLYDLPKARRTIGLIQNYLREIDLLIEDPVPVPPIEVKVIEPAIMPESTTSADEDPLYVFVDCDDSSTSAAPPFKKPSKKKKKYTNTFKGEDNEKADFNN